MIPGFNRKILLDAGLILVLYYFFCADRCLFAASQLAGQGTKTQLDAITGSFHNQAHFFGPSCSQLRDPLAKMPVIAENHHVKALAKSYFAEIRIFEIAFPSFVLYQRVTFAIQCEIQEGNVHFRLRGPPVLVGFC
jgi:hypothetical protein